MLTGRCAVQQIRRLSNLAAFINSGVRPKPSLLSRRVGLFGFDQLREPTGFETLTEKALNKTEIIRQKVIGLAKRSRRHNVNVVELLDEMSDSLCQVADMAEFVRLAHPDPDYRRHAHSCCAKIGRYVEELNTDQDLYRGFKQELNQLSDPTDARVGHLFLVDFEQSGIHLPDDKRYGFVQASERVQMLGSLFQQNVDMPTLVDASEMPGALASKLIRFFTYDGKTKSLAVDRFLADSPDRSLREATYRLFYAKQSQVDNIIRLLVNERHSLAQLAGFENFARRTICSNTLAGDVEFVNEIVQRISEAIRPAADKELNAIQTEMRADGIVQPVAPWDLIHYARRIRRNVVNEQANYSRLQEFFSLGSVVAGLDKLFGNLYQVQLHLDAAKAGELWSNDVIKLSVRDATGEILGHIFLDLFERPQKPVMECHFTIRGGRSLLNGMYQTPVVVLMLNFPVPRFGQPPLLSFPQIENLFHEFGHAMHSILGRTKYQHVTGTRCPTDFAEVPSVLMELFASDHRVAALFATHWKTGKAAPADDLGRMLHGVRHAFRLMDLQQQLTYTDFDLALHCPPVGSGPPVDDISGLYSDIWKKHSGIDMPTEVAQYQRFAHLVGYGSRYYSYLLSRAVADLLWKKLFQDDPLCMLTPSGQQLRRRMLVHGGMMQPRKLVENTLGISYLSPKEVSDAIVSQIVNP